MIILNCNCRFGEKLWSFSHKKTSNSKGNSHIFNIDTKNYLAEILPEKVSICKTGIIKLL